MDLSSHANLNEIGPMITWQAKDQLSCILECGKFEACIATTWNIQRLECGLITKPLNITNFKAREYSLTNGWDFLVKEEFACAYGGKS